MTCEARAVSVCGAVGDSDLARLAGLSTVIHVDSGFTFMEEGYTASHFFNVTVGTAKLYKLLPDGRRQITDFARPGDFLGLAAGRSYGFSAEALEPVRLCRFSRQKLTEMFNDFPAMERRLLATASHELLAAQEQLLLLGRKSGARARCVIPPHRGNAAARLSAGIPMSLPMTRGDIGDYLGLTIETVSRTMTALWRSGVIDVPSASDIQVRDFDALSRTANGSVIN